MTDHLTQLAPCSRVRSRAVGCLRAGVEVRPYAASDSRDLGHVSASAHQATGLPHARAAAGSAIGATAVEYQAEKSTVDSMTGAIWTMAEAQNMWNRTPKFGPYGHFQRWRFAT